MTDREAYDHIAVLTKETIKCMNQLRSEKDKKAGIYGPVGQAIWRLQDATDLFRRHVRRPAE